MAWSSGTLAFRPSAALSFALASTSAMWSSIDMGEL